jgi:DNA repair protein RecO (recombination protein O)
MSTRGQVRQDAQAGFVLHSYPFRETSLVVETFTRDHGRIALVARGARRPRSSLRGVLLSFQPLLLSWTGRSELRTLTRAEWQGAYTALGGETLMCGFYLNELLLKLLPRDDPHERLYGVYQATLEALAGKMERESILRRFELQLLRELGYAVTLNQDAETGEAIVPDQRYVYIVERGPVAAGASDSGKGVELAGQTLLDMQSSRFNSAVTQQQSKALMRTLINHYLGNQVLHTRQMLRELQDL